MSLENTTAKYEVQITRSGDGAAQAAREFQNLEKAAHSASHETDLAAEAMHKLHQSHLLGRDSLHALNGLLMLTGEHHIPILNEAVHSAHGALNLLGATAATTGIGVVGMATAFIGVGTAVWTAVEAFKAFHAHETELETETELFHQTAELIKRDFELLSKFHDMGLVNPKDYAAISTLLSAGENDELRKAQRQMLSLGLTVHNVDALEKFRRLQEQVSQDALNQFDKERAKAAELYNERMKQIAELAKQNKLITPEMKNTLENQAGAAYSHAVNESILKENAEKAKTAIETMDMEITLAELNGSKEREGYYDREFQYRVNTFKQLRQEGILTEEQYTQEFIKALQKRHEEEQQANQAANAAEQEQTQAMIRQFQQAQEIYALQSKDKKVKIAQQEYQESMEFYGGLAADYRITLDQMVEYCQAAEIKKLQAIKTAEMETERVYKQLEQRVEQTFASGMANAIVDFAKGTKSAEQAFREFAASFLEEVAKMIIEMEILAVLKSIVGGASGAASGGSFGSSGTTTGTFSPDAFGGVHYAASGLAGIASVSRPTYFPRFNVVAGEAGREMLTVLARPRFMEVGGIEAVVGQAGRNTLAITSAAQLASQGSGGPGGHIVIEIQHSEAAEARIVSSSVEKAEIRVTQQMNRNSRLREAVKQIQR